MPLPLPVSLERLQELVQKHGTPLQLYSESGIRDTTKELIRAFGSQFPKGGFKQFFAVKALPNPAILRIVVDEGCGLDCSSTSELWIAKKLGVTGENVMLTSNYTSQEDLAYAFDEGVVMNLDDISLIDSIVEIRGRTPELISFRLNPGLGRTDSETASNVLGGPDAKFGVPPFQIVEAYRKAKANGSTRFGIHMMTGSCVRNTEYWESTVTELLKAVAQIKSELDIDFEFINIGGGLGIPYRPEESTVNLDEVALTVRKAFEKNLKITLKNGENVQLFPENKEPRLFMENGRFVTGPHGFLVARCQAVKDTYERYYGLDACMANLMRPGMYGAYHHITVPTAKTDSPIEKANVVGTLCENNDWFAKHRELPRAQVGDLFVIHDTGAHSHSMGFNYNGKLHAPEVLIRPDGSDALIRKRQVVNSLYDDTIVPSDLGDTTIINSPRKAIPKQNRLLPNGQLASYTTSGLKFVENYDPETGTKKEEDDEDSFCVIQ